MAFNIEDFKAKRDGRNTALRTNRFRVLLPNPPAAMAGNLRGFEVRDLEFWCSTIQLPGYQTLTHNLRRYTYGPNEVRPFASNFQQLQLQIDNDGDGTVWKFFSSWMQSILPHDFGTIQSKSEHGNRNTVYTMEYPDNYVRDFNIEVYQETGKKVYNIRVRRAFPTNLNSVPLMWAEQNQAMRFDVFMDYSDWSLELESLQ